MLNKKLAILTVLVMIATLVLAACGAATPETIIVKETSIVVETVEVEVKGETVVQEVTKVVEVETVVTATPEPESTEVPKGELEGLWYSVNTEPPTLDIQVAQDTTSHLIIDNCIEGLMQYDKDGNIVPAGATGYEVSEDGLVYTVHLRENVWSDGVPVIAQHFVDAFVRLMDPATAANYSWLMYDVENGEAFNTGEIDDPSLMGIAAPDDYTVVYTLKQPTSYFGSILAFATTMPVRLDIIEQYGDEWTEAGNYLCNGPYLLDTWEHENEVVLVKNPDYWNADAVQIEKVTIPILAEDATSLALYENGELHVSPYPSDDLPRIQEDELLSTELRQLPRPGVYYIGVNTSRPPTDNVLVRMALASGIDRRGYLDNVTFETWRTEATSTTPPGIMGFQGKDAGYDFNPEQAQAWLEEAGWCLEEGAAYRTDCETGEAFPVISLDFNRADYNYDVIEAVASMWEENLNIPTNLSIKEWGVYIDYLDACNDSQEAQAACEYNAYRMGWVMDYGDAQNQLGVVFAPDTGFNYTGIKWTGGEFRDRFNALMDQAASEVDNEARAELYKQADRIIVEEFASIIPLHYYDRNIMVKTGVYFEYPPFGAPHFDRWSFE